MVGRTEYDGADPGLETVQLLVQAGASVTKVGMVDSYH